MTEDGELSGLFRRIRQGDEQARDELFERVYDELRELAGKHMRRERPNHSWQPTALVHEVYEKLVKVAGNVEGRRAFFAAASQAMYCELIDHARKKNSIVRGGRWTRVPWDEFQARIEANTGVDLLVLHEFLELLERERPRHSDALKRQIFGGQRIQEIAEDLKVSVDSVNKYLRFAKAWLKGKLS
jgi:RNA polymerase sigma-70 factor, ECF subfamily